jgi:hypothetical protein
MAADVRVSAGPFQVAIVEWERGGVSQRMKIPELGQLLDALSATGWSPLHLITAPAGTDVQVFEVQIYDPHAAVRTVPWALLLAVGIPPSGAAAKEMVRRAAQDRHTGLVVKSYGEPLTDLVVAAENAGVAVLQADDDVAWHHVEALLSSMHRVLSVMYAIMDG